MSSSFIVYFKRSTQESVLQYGRPQANSYIVLKMYERKIDPTSAYLLRKSNILHVNEVFISGQFFKEIIGTNKI